MTDGNFRVTLSVRKEPGARPVFFKVESGRRFLQLETVKLCCNTTYRIDISFKPPQPLQLLKINGEIIETIERNRNDRTASTYSAYYTTRNAQKSERGHRKNLKIAMRILGSGYSTSLQIKYYKQEDQSHSERGLKLHSIELECTSADNLGFLIVDKNVVNLIHEF